jgi:DNA polymerase-3 subunit alpha
VGELGDGDVVSVAGIVAAINRRFTKRGEPYAVIRLEDLTGGVQVVVFPGVFDKVAPLITPDRVVLVKGRADLRGRELQLVALELVEPELSGIEDEDPPTSDAGSRPSHGGEAGLEERQVMEVRPSNGGSSDSSPSDPLVVEVPASACTGGLVNRLKGLLALHPGQLPVVLTLVGEAESTRLRIGEGWRVDGSPALLSELRRLFGESSVRLVRVIDS